MAGCWKRNYIPLFIDDIYRGHLWTYNDITERRRSEIKLKKQEEKIPQYYRQHEPGAY